MNIAILSIGDELLTGDTLNTNAAWIGQTLTPLGCQITHHFTIPDSIDIIKSTLESLVQESCSWIILTGGLGPTDDDKTQEALFDFVGTDSTFDEKYWNFLTDRFKKFGIKIPESNRNQALRPKIGDVIPNPIGSARGLIFNVKESIVISLPGVPAEMKAMMKDTVIPDILKQSLTPRTLKTIRTTGIAESALIELIAPVMEQNNHVKVGYYPSLLGVDIRLSGDDRTVVESLSNQLINQLGEKYFTTEKEPIESVVISKAKEIGKTISVAESCTGGLIGHRLTEISGSSDVFLGGLVVYSNESKASLLQVKTETLESFGAVSEETAREMAENVRTIFKSDFGIAVTGIAGPTGGTKEKPVGLIFLALATESGVKVKKLHLGSHRKNNKLRTSQIALNWLRLSLSNE